jgi:hypothetical protein
MSRKPALHKAPSVLPTEVVLRAKACGGFTISGVSSDYGRSSMADSAAFTDLDEALEWLRVNMARPVQQPETGKAVRQ